MIKNCGRNAFLRRVIMFVPILLVFAASAGRSSAADLMDASKLGLGIARVSFDIGRLGSTAGFRTSDPDGPKYDIPRMIRANPAPSEYGTSGIVWLKHTLVRQSPSGGTIIERLLVIRGREGLDSEWLNWNIQTPANGSAEVTSAFVCSAETGEKLYDVTPEYSEQRGLHSVVFDGLRGDFIIVLEWREKLPESLYAEGLVWFQEQLPVWESVVEIRPSSPDSMRYRAFPYDIRPDKETRGGAAAFVWHEVNCAAASGGLSPSPRRGVAFSMRGDDSALVRVMREMSDAEMPKAPSEAVKGFKKSSADGVRTLLNWLYRQPEIKLTEGTARRMPSSAPWSRGEKIAAAEKWLRENGVEARMRWRLPIEPNENPPASPALLSDALLEIPVFKGSAKTQNVMYYGMDGEPSSDSNSQMLSGAAVHGLSEEGRIIRRRIPDGKASDNRLLSSMKLKMDESGALSGTVRVVLGGAWKPFLIRSAEPSGAELDAVIRGMFGELRGISGVKHKQLKDGAEISFSLSGIAGVMSAGGGNILMNPPFAVPEAFVAIENSSEPVIELRFPFVIEQNMTVAMPKNFERALMPSASQPVTGKVGYTDSIRQRRSSLYLEAKCEAGTVRADGEQRNNLIRCIALWKNFSSRQIPVQLKIKK